MQNEKNLLVKQLINFYIIILLEVDKRENESYCAFWVAAGERGAPRQGLPCPTGRQSNSHRWHSPAKQTDSI